MATVRPLADAELSPEAAAVFADIRATRGADFVNLFWRALAHDPGQLARVWAEAKAVMAPGALDPLTKELVYIRGVHDQRLPLLRALAHRRGAGQGHDAGAARGTSRR